MGNNLAISNKKYMVRLLISSALVVLICVLYLKMQFQVTNSNSKINSIQTELTVLKERNDAIYNEAINSINISEIEKTAINEYKMIKADSEHIITYEQPAETAVVQHKSIPVSGVFD